MTILFLLCLLLPPVMSSKAQLRAVPFDPSCQDLLQDKFYFATQVKVANVVCADEKDLDHLNDLILDHLSAPHSIPNTKNMEETDICRTGPASYEPCSGYLAESEHDASSTEMTNAETSYEWHWRGTGSCGIFQPNPKCDPSRSDQSIRRALDMHRLSRGGEDDEQEIPDLNKKWLSPLQKTALQELVAQREALIDQETKYNRLAEKKDEPGQIVGRNHGIEKQILTDILELFTTFESELEELKPKLRAFESALESKLGSLLWDNLQASCFVARPDVVVVTTPMATREYADAYVREQC